jgi:predicted ribosomally synthesized peptide with nif11-like leader
MSVEQAREFLEAVRADAALRARLESAGGGAKGLAAVRAAGYDVTVEDLKAFAAQEGAQEELSDKELEGASGGGFFIGLGIPIGAFGYYMYKKYTAEP